MTASLELPTGVRTIRIGHIAPGVTEADLRGLFVAFGRVLTHSRPVDPTTGRPGDFVLVQLTDPGATRAQAALNGRLVKGQRVDCERTSVGRPRTPSACEVGASSARALAVHRPCVPGR